MKKKRGKTQNQKTKGKSNEKELHLLVFNTPRTFGQKASDRLTKIAGSWGFIIGFLVFIAIWMYFNVHILIQYQLGKPWDPYPFILLNLILSCLAAIQAPIILMSQNRQAQRDRIKAQNDYRVNKKAEEEIREIKNLLLKRKHK